MCTAEIYLLAEQSSIKAAQAEKLMQQGLHVKSLERTERGKMALAPGNRERLRGYEELAAEMCRNMGLDSVPLGTIVDLNQTVGFSGLSFNGVLGALLRRHTMWEMRTRRELLVYPEEFAAQGWPVHTTLVDGHSMAPWGPHYHRLFEACTDTEVQELLGNGMHLLVCQAWLIFCMACLSDSNQDKA